MAEIAKIKIYGCFLFFYHETTMNLAHLADAVARFHDRHVEGAATQIEDQQIGPGVRGCVFLERKMGM